VTTSPKEIRRIRATWEAAEWTQRLQGGHLTGAERADFVDWLRESPVHVAEILRSEQVHVALSEFTAWDDVVAGPREAAPTPTSVVAFEESRRRDVSPARRSSVSRAVYRGTWLIAASVLLLAGAGLVLAPRMGSTTFTTQAGERREVTLADDSVVTLASDTTLHVRLTSNLRSIQLDNGEAQFHVTKDPNRPFIVDAAKASIRAVGTVFSILNNADTVVVTVTEGRVTVNPLAHAAEKGSPSGGGPNIAVSANQQIAVSPSGRATPVREVQRASGDDHALAASQLSFDGETVHEIVQRFNAVNHVQIRVLDEKLAQRRLSGVFSATDPQSFVAFLEAAAGVNAVVRPNNEIDVGSSTDSSTQFSPH
jgi:transmembrane sensor